MGTTNWFPQIKVFCCIYWFSFLASQQTGRKTTIESLLDTQHNTETDFRLKCLLVQEVHYLNEQSVMPNDYARTCTTLVFECLLAGGQGSLGPTRADCFCFFYKDKLMNKCSVWITVNWLNWFVWLEANIKIVSRLNGWNTFCVIQCSWRQSFS